MDKQLKSPSPSVDTSEVHNEPGDGKAPETITAAFTSPENRKKYHNLLRNTMATLDADIEGLRAEMKGKESKSKS